MEKIENNNEISNIKENKVVGNITLNNSSIEFKGKNNILYCNGNIIIENCKLRFTGNNSIIFFDENKYPFSLNIRVGNDSVFYLGKNCFINRTSNMYATERKNIIIGNEFLLSFDSYFRTADPHVIYDVNTKKRVNFSKSILIGDHVWIGQGSLILKGTIIGSGAIIGGNSVSSNKKIKSNTIYAGNPIRKVKDNVCYATPMSTHNYTLEEEIDSEETTQHIYKYKKNEDTINLELIDKELLSLSSVQEKIDYINNNIVNNQNENRFYIGDKNE